MSKRRAIDRKTKIEQVLKQAKRIQPNTAESDLAWTRLCAALENLTDPEARMPRFNTLLNAIWVAATNEQS